MRSFLKHPAGRIALAIAISLLLHAILLFGPRLKPPVPVETPPLTAHLEPLPKAKPPIKPRTAFAHTIKTRPAVPTAAPTVLTADTGQPALPEKPAEPKHVEEQAASPSKPQASPPLNPLPRHAELTYAAYMGRDMRIGEVRHRLDLDGTHYTLYESINTTGLARLFKKFVMNQKSAGTITEQGLRPDRFSEERLTSNGTETTSAEFDWQGRLVKFSSGSSAPLPEGTQDILSVLYQFSQLPLDQPRVALHVSNGKKLESYEVEIGPEENVQTGMGLLRAIPLRKIHGPDEEGLKIWLGLEYKLLPVKVQQLDKKDRVSGEIDISEIRVSDE